MQNYCSWRNIRTTIIGFFGLCLLIGCTVLPAKSFALGVSLGVSPQSPQPILASIKLTANVLGIKKYEYQFWVGTTASSGAVTWVLLRDYSTVKYTYWVPVLASQYQLMVYARPAGHPTSTPITNRINYTISGLNGTAVYNYFWLSRYQGNKSAALSFTFDDGIRSQLDVAVPLINELGFKSTFFIPTAWAEDPQTVIPVNLWTATWADWKQVAAAGHEIENHTITHPVLTSITDEAQLLYEINGPREIIKQQTGRTPLAIAFPGYFENQHIRDLAFQNHIAVKGKNECTPYGRDDNNLDTSFTVDVANGLVASAIGNHGWLVPGIHGFIVGELAPPMDPNVFRQHLYYVKSRENELWIDTYAHVSAYIQERDNADLTLLSWERGKMKFVVSNPLDPAKYQVPVTVIIAPGVTSVQNLVATREGGDSTMKVRYEQDAILIDAVPSPKPITVTWQ